jgi:hypothetical protein
MIAGDKLFRKSIKTINIRPIRPLPSEKGWIWTSEYMSFDKTGYPRIKAFEWLIKRIPKNPDINVNNANINTESVYAMRDIFETPKQVEIEMNKQGYPKVVAEIWGY